MLWATPSVHKNDWYASIVLTHESRNLDNLQLRASSVTAHGEKSPLLYQRKLVSYGKITSKIYNNR